MRRLLRKCPNCGRYTLEEKCPNCKSATYSAHPPKFSPEDKYGKWRRKIKFGGKKNRI